MLGKGNRKGVRRWSATGGGLSCYSPTITVPNTRTGLKGSSKKSSRAKITDENLIGKFVYQINRELVINFGKTSTQAKALVFNANLPEYLSKHPIALHDSPHEWAIKLLTKNKDVETLERYYSSL